MPSHLSRILLPLALLAILFAVALSAAPQEEEQAAAAAASALNYKFAAIDFPLPDDRTAGQFVEYTRPLAINDAGVIVGLVQRHGYPCPGGNCGPETFLYAGGKFTLLYGPLYQGGFTSPIAVNNHGEILIVQDTQSGPPPRYFVYDMAKKSFRAVSPFIQIAGAQVRVQSIGGFNDGDDFVGTYNYQGHPYAGFGNLPIGPDGDMTPPAALGSFTPIQCPNNRSASVGGLNNAGQVAGDCSSFQGVRSGFLFNGGKMTLFDHPGAQITVAHGINDAGIVIGQYTPKAAHAGAWRPIGYAYAPGSAQFIPVAQTPNSHGDLIVPRGINRQGRIIGDGADNGVGFLATPTPANPLKMSPQ